MQTPTLINFKPTGINYCNNVRNTNYLHSFGLHFKGRELNNDTFEPSKKYKEEDFNSIKNSIKKDKFIGKGFEGRVFEMEDPNYVVKIPKKFFDNKKIDDNKLKENLVEEPITEQDKVNHITKKYKNGIVIMNKVAGKQIKTKEEMNEVADLPVKSYQDLLNQIIDAESKGMEFDFAMNNVLYDKDTGSLTAIDFRPFKEGERKFKPLEKMYFVFDCFAQPYEKKVSGKIISAALENLKSDADPQKAKLDYDFGEIARIVQYNNPRYWGIMENIKSNTQIIKFDRLHAQSELELSQIDYDIDYIQNSINTYLITSESEQA